MGLELARAYVSVGVNSSGVGRSLSAVEAEAKELNKTFAEAVSWNERYSESLLNLNSHLVAGRITQDVYNKALQQLDSQSPKAVAAAKAQAQAEQERSATMQRGRMLTESMMTASQRYAREMGDLQGMLSAGAISQDTFNKAVRNLDIGQLRGVSSQLSEIGGTAALMGGLVTAAFGASARSAVMAAGKYEQTMIAFSTMMGSAEKASGLLSDLTKFAAETPFEMPEIEQVARGMVMFGEDSKTLMDTLTMLGNAASGTSSSFGMIGLVYNQIRGVGHLLTQDFRQLSTRGVISLKDIAKHYKITDAAAQEMISKGKVSFADFRSILMGLTSGSGRFSNMMQKQSQSMLGLLSTFSDAVQITMRQIGEEIVPVAKWFVGIGIQAVSAFSSMDPWLKKTIAGTLALGTVSAGLFTTIASGAFAAGKMISAYTSTITMLTSMSQATRIVTGSIEAEIAAGELLIAMNNGVAASTTTMTASAQAATFALKALTVAKYAMIGAGIALAAALSAVMGYKLGKWAADQTEGAKKFDKTIKGISDEIEGQKTMGIDLTETSKGDVERFIDKTESKIAAAKARVKKLGGRWFGGGEEIKQEEAGIALMEDRIAKAREKLLGFAEAGGLPELTNQAEESKKSMNSLSTEVSAVNQRLEEARQKSKGSFTFGGGFDKSQFQQAEKNIEFYEKRLSELNSKLEAEGQKHRDLMTKIADTAKASDEKATAKIKVKTAALKTENDTYGMTASQALAYKLAVDKVSDAEIKAHVTETERAASLKRMTTEKEAATKAEYEWVESLKKEEKARSIPAALQPQNPYGPFGFESPFVSMAEDFERFSQAYDMATGEAEALAQQMRQVDEAGGKSSMVFKGFQQSLLQSVNPTYQLSQKLKELDYYLAQDDPSKYAKQIKRMADEIAGVRQPLQDMIDKYNEFAAAGQGDVFLKGQFQAVADALNPLKRLEDKIKDLNWLLAKGMPVEQYNRAIQELGRSITESVDPAAAMKAKVAELDALLKAKAISQDTYNKKLIEYKKALTDAMTGMSGFAEFGQKIQGALMGAGGPGLGMVDLQPQGRKRFRPQAPPAVPAPAPAPGPAPAVPAPAPGPAPAVPAPAPAPGPAPAVPAPAPAPGPAVPAPAPAPGPAVPAPTVPPGPAVPAPTVPPGPAVPAPTVPPGVMAALEAAQATEQAAEARARYDEASAQANSLVSAPAPGPETVPINTPEQDAETERQLRELRANRLGPLLGRQSPTLLQWAAQTGTPFGGMRSDTELPTDFSPPKIDAASLRPPPMQVPLAGNWSPLTEQFPGPAAGVPAEGPLNDRQDDMVKALLDLNAGQRELITETKKPKKNTMVLGPG